IISKGPLMSKFFPVLLFCLVPLGVATTSGQITITASDVGAALAPGKMITTHTDTATHKGNLGSLGSTSWDFSSILTNYTDVSTFVRPDTTPYYGDFPGATHAFKSGGVYIYYIL